MKKCIIILFCFILVGCTNKITLDFNDKIDAKIEFSFSEREYKILKGDSEDISGEVEAIMNEIRPIKDSYDEVFEEVRYSDENNNYSGEYKYTYTYDNFKDNDLFKRCFEYAAVEEDDKTIFVYLKGSSECSPFELRVKANNRMLSNNAIDKESDEYIWNVEKENNDIHFNISKTKIGNRLFTLTNIFYFVLAVAIAFGIYYLKNKNKKTNK